MRDKGERAGAVLAVLCLCLCLASSLVLSGCGKKPATAEEVRQADGVITIGETVTLYIEKTEYMSEVKPPSPIGYYDYYPQEEGWRYLVVSGTTENSGAGDFDPESCYVESYVDGEPREGKLLILAAPGTEFWDVLPAGSEKGVREFYLFTLVREEEEPEEISLFYNDDHSQAGEAEPWDHQIRVSL